MTFSLKQKGESNKKKKRDLIIFQRRSIAGEKESFFV